MEFSLWLHHVPWLVQINGSAAEISIVWLFHFLGYFLVVGTTALVDLRLLGLAGRDQSASQLAKQLFPWTWLGLAFVVVSGFIMFAGSATLFYPAFAFRFKLFVFFVAILFGLIVQRNVPKWDRLPSIPATAKIVALVSLLLWVGMILASVEVPAFIDGI